LAVVFQGAGGPKPRLEEGPAGIAAVPPRKIDPEAWKRQVADLPSWQQVTAVAARLKECNPGFNGQVTPKTEIGVVTELEFLTDDVTDLSPLQALPGLYWLKCTGSAPGKGQLRDLAPLRGLKLTFLSCDWTKVKDLGPLEDMELEILYCNSTQVESLWPLKNMKKLKYLYCRGTKVDDLSPLKGMKLTSIDCRSTPVTDLTPLQGMKLASLFCSDTKVTSLEPLRGMPLKLLSCDFKPERDGELLRSLDTLEAINGTPAREFLNEVDGKRP
jgi:Leucine-rich repeat (LRR) protein